MFNSASPNKFVANLLAEQPGLVLRARHGIGAGLFDEIRLVRDPDHGEVALRRRVTNAAAKIATMIAGQHLQLAKLMAPLNAFLLVAHQMIVARARRL